MKQIFFIISILFIITSTGCIEGCDKLDILFHDPVIIPVEDITLKPTLDLMLSNDASYLLVPEITPANATNKDVTWSISDDSIADVSEEGLVTPVDEGDAFITVKTNDGDFEAECLVTVYEPVIRVTTVLLDKSSIELPIGSGEQLAAIVEPPIATNKNVTWSTNDKEIATVSHDGVVTAVGVGETTITARSEEDSETKDDCRVTVVWKTFQGDYTITNEDDLNKLINYSVITGNLVIKDTSLTNLDGLSNLTSVGGYLDIKNNIELPTIEANNLLNQLINFTGTSTICGNKDGDPCN